MPGNLPFRRVIGIHSVPRSGSSWLGQIFNSHPDVAYRYQPLFAYAFNQRISEAQDIEKLPALLKDIYDSDDTFIHQKGSEQLGSTPDFANKNPSPQTLVLKMVRFHDLIPNFLKLPDYKCIGLVRDPRAVINSFLNTPREWRAGWDPLAEWRTAPLKNQEHAHNCYGFVAWLEITQQFLRLQGQFPDRFRILQYENLISNMQETIETLFGFFDLEVTEQTTRFLHASAMSKDLTHDHSVYKNPAVMDRWRAELPPQIAEAIALKTKKHHLNRFLYD